MRRYEELDRQLQLKKEIKVEEDDAREEEEGDRDSLGNNWHQESGDSGGNWSHHNQPPGPDRGPSPPQVSGFSSSFSFSDQGCISREPNLLDVSHYRVTNLVVP